MPTQTTSLSGRLHAIRNRSLDRARAIWSELDYAQQRMFEIQTGLQPRGRRHEIADLERLYAYRAHRS
jgi:lipase chaperone LimK